MSPRLPRDVFGERLAKLLEGLSYFVTRRKGSHLRLTTQDGGEHHVTVPDHESLRVGTLNGIVNAVAEYAGMTRDAVAEKFFGRG
jgi:predicted RNA binding protein YcfA (HicA-like mRNA interferase family)